MNRTGFIGYGHMGSAMLRSFLSSGAIDPKEVVITTRTPGKLSELCAKYPDIEVVQSSDEVASRCKRIFLCVGTFDVAGIIGEMQNHIDEMTHLITISGGLEIKSIASVFDGKITRLLPTLICEVNEGVTLVCHNHKVKDADKAFISSVFEKIGKVKIINEGLFEISGFLTSCSPAFFAAILHQLGLSVTHSDGYSYEEACEMLLNTMLGTMKLLMQTNETFEQLVKRVATKGGATEKGVQVLKERLPAVFNETIEKALVPHEVRKEKTRKQFFDMKASQAFD